jgi:NADH-quinone oxidoreductase subunit L
MLVLVLGASYPVMFVGWEGRRALLVPADRLLVHEKSARDAGKKAFIVNRIGDFGFLLGDVPDLRHIGTLDFAGCRARRAGRTGGSAGR